MKEYCSGVASGMESHARLQELKGGTARAKTVDTDLCKILIDGKEGAFGWACLIMGQRGTSNIIIMFLSSCGCYCDMAGGREAVKIHECLRFFNFEKKEGIVKSQSMLDAFYGTLEECELFDLAIRAMILHRKTIGRMGKLLKRDWIIFYAVEWLVLFPEAEVIHLDENISDHLLLLLRLKQNHVRREKEKKRFMFENLWAKKRVVDKQ
ncbi:hypothetical protein Cgig2_006298 [Carnegiea gigantea]|uniref:Uncharacterized protein n=1 Tax=Carnegiea gigantea TaxID=171969 RepID=A0A9Q1K7M2_9CARY|nr:hypothetical protein Cgig2_006298 [Carnegiea gigantea]